MRPSIRRYWANVNSYLMPCVDRWLLYVWMCLWVGAARRWTACAARVKVNRQHRSRAKVSRHKPRLPLQAEQWGPALVRQGAEHARPARPAARAPKVPADYTSACQPPRTPDTPATAAPATSLPPRPTDNFLQPDSTAVLVVHNHRCYLRSELSYPLYVSP